MKKKNLFAAILFVAFVSASVSTNQAHAQEDGYVKTVFVAEDALGNTDTVMLIITPGSTEGIDPELGEVNLFQVAPQKDLEMRIIQRDKALCEVIPTAWLCDFMGPSLENIDLKVDYRFPPAPEKFIPGRSSFGNSKNMRSCHYVLKIYAKHYPVSISLVQIETVGNNGYSDATGHGTATFEFMESDEETGLNLSYRKNVCFWPPYDNPPFAWCDTLPFLLARFCEPSQNNLIAIYHNIDYKVVSISDVNNQQPPLYPNPASEFIVIAEGRYGETFTIVDLEGRTVKTFTVEIYPYSVDIRDLHNGIYILQGQDNKMIYKFIKGEK